MQNVQFNLDQHRKKIQTSKIVSRPRMPLIPNQIPQQMLNNILLYWYILFMRVYRRLGNCQITYNNPLLCTTHTHTHNTLDSPRVHNPNALFVVECGHIIRCSGHICELQICMRASGHIENMRQQQSMAGRKLSAIWLFARWRSHILLDARERERVREWKKVKRQGLCSCQ